MFFFSCLGDFDAPLYTHVEIVGPEFSDFAKVFDGPLNFMVEFYYKERD